MLLNTVTRTLPFSLSSSGTIGVSRLPAHSWVGFRRRGAVYKMGSGVEGSGSLLHKLQPPVACTHTHTHPWRRIRLSINHLAEDAVLFGLGPLLGPPSSLCLCCSSGCETQREKQVSKSSLAFPTSQMGPHTPWTGLRGLLGDTCIALAWWSNTKTEFLKGCTPERVSSSLFSNGAA